MLFPIGDDNSDRHIRPYVTYALIAINVFIFIFLQRPSDAFTYGYAVIPAEILSGQDFPSPGRAPGSNTVIPQAPGPQPIQLTILSAMFMHGGWAHLGGNMLYLWIFGDNVEDAMGHFKYLVFYLLCGVLATGAHIFASLSAGGLNLFIPSLGASGAIAGVLGGYLMLYPTKRVMVLMGFLGIFAVPAVIVIGLWIATQIFSGVGSIALTQQTRESGGGVAYFAHIGGAIAGLVLVWLFRNPRIQRRAQERYNFGSSGRY
ncbi:MAG: rhomboid family intramembrane serine protease [Armatimonadetes bacterium]|nr:rhomboid family intramembrane serine protease [Armatimonadota bacterium]